jgi:hypothetical protein
VITLKVITSWSTNISGYLSTDLTNVTITDTFKSSGVSVSLGVSSDLSMFASFGYGNISIKRATKVTLGHTFVKYACVYKSTGNGPSVAIEVDVSTNHLTEAAFIAALAIAPEVVGGVTVSDLSLEGMVGLLQGLAA